MRMNQADEVCASELAALATKLAASGRFKILSRLETDFSEPRPLTSDERIGVLVDIETTGLDPQRDEIIELAAVQFVYSLCGQIRAVYRPYNMLQEPSIPIPAQVTSLTGLDAESVAGHSIDIALLDQVFDECALIIAHNAKFDRRFLEKIMPSLAQKPWGCSAQEVDWHSHGFESPKLAMLKTEFGFFNEGHRASDDAL